MTVFTTHSSCSTSRTLSINRIIIYIYPVCNNDVADQLDKVDDTDAVGAGDDADNETVLLVITM